MVGVAFRGNELGFSLVWEAYTTSWALLVCVWNETIQKNQASGASNKRQLGIFPFLFLSWEDWWPKGAVYQNAKLTKITIYCDLWEFGVEEVWSLFCALQLKLKNYHPAVIVGLGDMVSFPRTLQG